MHQLRYSVCRNTLSFAIHVAILCLLRYSLNRDHTHSMRYSLTRDTLSIAILCLSVLLSIAILSVCRDTLSLAILSLNRNTLPCCDTLSVAQHSVRHNALSVAILSVSLCSYTHCFFSVEALLQQRTANTSISQ
jgi:hypothetical protein